MAGKGGRVYRNYYKRHMGKNKGGWKQAREVGMAGVVGGKGRKLYLNNTIQKYLIIKKNKDQ